MKNPPMDEFEVAILSRDECPDDWRQWPVQFKEMAERARDNLLEKHPSVRVVSETTMCIAPGHPRYPDTSAVVPWSGRFFLVLQIKLDQPVSE